MDADELRLEGVHWVYVGSLLRGEIDVGWVTAGRHVLLDGHGLVRVPEPGPLRARRRLRPGAAARRSMLKLADEEAAAVGPLDVPELIVTHGARGATVNGSHIAAEPVDGDPTGAGDMFGAAYLVRAPRAPSRSTPRAEPRPSSRSCCG